MAVGIGEVAAVHEAQILGWARIGRAAGRGRLVADRVHLRPAVHRQGDQKLAGDRRSAWGSLEKNALSATMSVIVSDHLSAKACPPLIRIFRRSDDVEGGRPRHRPPAGSQKSSWPSSLSLLGSCFKRGRSRHGWGGIAATAAASSISCETARYGRGRTGDDDAAQPLTWASRS